MPFPRRGLLAAAGLLCALAAAGGDWPQFRGPHGDGVSDERGLPVTWGLAADGKAENVAWKVRLPGPGASGPVVVGDRVFVTCYTGYGAGGGGTPADLRRHLLCLDRRTGKLRWDRAVAARLPETPYAGFITEHGYASSTPAADGERVYAFFGRTGVFAFDFEGKQLWHAPTGDARNSWGSAASPVVYKGLVLVNATVECSSLLALDARTGREAWRARGLGDSWATPLVVRVPGGKDEVVLRDEGGLLAFDPDAGRQLWECNVAGTGEATSTPVARDGVVYMMGAGGGGRAVLAVRAGGRGDVTASRILWKKNVGAGICSPVLAGPYLYWVSGEFGCLRADTGEVVFRRRLYETRTEYVSPVAADGKLFAFTRRSGAFVLAAAGDFQLLAHNDLGDPGPFNAGPAVSGGQLFVRSNTQLYCLGRTRPR